jgi:FtsP/CotA-like multicopper oxidase with cupredoxin domain
MPNAVLGLLAMTLSATTTAVPLPGGTLNPTTIPKYVTPLVIPPVMNSTSGNGSTNNDYDIAVRQFQQQILPGGIWNTLNNRADAFPATTVWSYGPDSDPLPDSSVLGGGVGIAPAPNSQFNYPAYTIENTYNMQTSVDWINDLVSNPWACKSSANPNTDTACNHLPHLLPIDRTLHWANPEQLPCADPTKTKDCRPADSNGGILQQNYTGPVPIVTHVHGAHVNPDSDGYPEAWWLPRANDIPPTYAKTGTLVNNYARQTNPAGRPGVAEYIYRNDQPSATLWYHDHALGMTRNNVYAGPAGFWLVRNSGGGEDGLVTGTLPGPAPVYGEDLATTNLPAALNGSREKYREIPIVIQDRSFNADGSLFYPANRAFFEGLGNGQVVSENAGNGLNIPTVGNGPSDIAPIWNPEAFFNTMVVNGVTWPVLEVAPAIYRFRLLNGCNSRFLNLALVRVKGKSGKDGEIPIYQIGAEQSLLPQVVHIETGFATPLPGTGVDVCTGNAKPNKNGTGCINPVPASDPARALLMGLAERADVLVDFSGLQDGDVVQMINTAPDAPFGGFGDPPADPGTTGQVMQFVVRTALMGTSPTDPLLASPGNSMKTNPNAATPPASLALTLPDPTDPANTASTFTNPRDMALLEEESILVCATISLTGQITWDSNAHPDPTEPETCLDNTTNDVVGSMPFAPKAAVLGVNGASGGDVTLWSAPIVTNPGSNSTETWEIWNHTVDGHPIHLHLVKFKVVNREVFDPVSAALSGVKAAPEPTEAGWKDTVIAYPGEVTRVNAHFDIDGLYVWHCHIVEHEDNEMMVPYCVGDVPANASGCGAVSPYNTPI